MELKRASLILNTPPVTPRNSMLLSATSSAAAMNSERMFDLQEFLNTLGSGDPEAAIPEVEETESEQQFQQRGQRGSMEFRGSTEFRRGSTEFHRGSTEFHRGSTEFRPSRQSTSSAEASGFEFNLGRNVNTNNSNSDGISAASQQLQLEDSAHTPTEGRTFHVAKRNGHPPPTRNSGSEYSIPTLSVSGGDASQENRDVRQGMSTGARLAAVRQTEMSGSTFSVQYLLPSAEDMMGPVSRSKSTEALHNKEAKRRWRGKKVMHVSSEYLDETGGRRQGQNPAVNARKVHRSSADLQHAPSPRTTRSRSEASRGSSTLSGLTDLSRKGEARFLMNPPKRSRQLRHSLPLAAWGSQPISGEGAPSDAALQGSVGRPDHSQDSVFSPKSDDSLEWYEYGQL